MKGIARITIVCVLTTIILAVALGPVCAGLIGGNFYVVGTTARFPDAAYDSVDAKYLVVWPDYNYSPIRIFGRFVSNTGVPSGSAFQISDGTVYALYPTLAYNSTNNEFLVTWDDGRGPDKIAGQRVRGSDGALLGGNFTIGTTSGGRSSVAWSSGSNCYMVVYYLAAGNVDVYGQRVSNTGGLLGSEVNISNDATYSGYPSVGYASSGNQFLATWDDAPGSGYISGQRIDAASGAFLGSKIAITGMGAEDRSSIAYDSVNNRWLVQFNCQANAGYSYDQYGQLVTTSGALYGSLIPIAHTAAFEGETLLGCDVAGVSGRFFSMFQQDSNLGGQEIMPSGALPGLPVTLGTNTGGHGGIAADTTLNRFLVVWESFESSTYYIRGQVYEINPNPAPGPVKSFVAASGGGLNSLSWTNPDETDYTGVMIRFKTSGYPTSTSDGTLIVDKAGSPGANDSHLHSGLTNGVTYYYTAFSHDSTPNYGLPAYSSGMPTAALCFADAFAYADGNLNGNGGWAGSAGANIGIVSQTVRILGGQTAQDAIKTVTCGDPGTGYITVTVKVQRGIGTDYMWDLWIDDAAGLNLARWYGAGTTARGRIGGTVSVTATQTLTGGWDELKVKINPYTNATEFFFNGGSLGSLDHGQTGAGNTIGRLRFTRGTSSTVDGNYLYFDDLQIGESAPTTNNASYVSDTIPSTMIANQQYAVTVTMQNTGTSTWTQAAGHKLGAVGDTDPFGVTRVDLGGSDSIGPGQQKAFSFTMTAPATPALYTSDWQMLQEGVEWFGGQLVKQVTVNAANPPAAPTVTAPANGATVTTVTPTITWTGDAHDQYQVRVSLQNDSNTSTGGWDSGTVVSSGNSCVTGTLRNWSFYYVFVRLHNTGGWGNWSAAGYSFIVNTDTVNGTVYLGDAMPTTKLWQVYDTGSYENGGSITSTIVADGGYSTVWKMRDNSTVNRCKEKYSNGMNISFDTGASVAARVKATSVTGTPTYCLGISNGNVGGMFLRILASSVVLVDINGISRGSYAVSSNAYHKYQLTVQNSTIGNNATADWNVYVDGTLRITWTGAGLDNGFDGWMAGQAGTAAKGYWWFDYIGGRADGAFTPAQWDPVY